MSAVGGLISYLTNAMRTPEDTTSRHQRQDEAQNEPAETHNAPPTSQARPTTDTVDTNQVKSANSRVTSHKAESTPRHVGNASAPSSSTATKARASPNQTEIQAPKSQQNVEYVALSEENDRLKQTNANQKDEITRLRKEYAHASRSSAWQVGNLGHRLDDSKRDLKTAAEQNRPSQERIKQLEEQLKKGLEQRDQWSHKAEEHQKKSDDLQSQVNDLGRRVAAQNRSDTHIADNELHDRMRQLFFDVQNWALNGFRKSGPVLDLSKASAHTLKFVREAMPSYSHPQVKRPKTRTLQVIVARFLTCAFDEPALLCDHVLRNLRDVEAALRDLAHHNPEHFNEWRANAYKIVYAEDEKTFDDAAAKACDRIVDRIDQTVKDLIQPGMTPLYRKKLKKIVDSALRLSRDLRMRRAVHTFQFIYSGVFDPFSMADESGNENPDLGGRHIDITLFPSLHKRGDDNGANMHTHSVIFKSRVVVEADDRDDDAHDE